MNSSKLALAVAPALLMIACGDDTGSGGGGGGSAQTCTPSAGCPAVESECVAFVDNSGKDKFSLRLTDLIVEAPAALTDPTIKNLLGTGISLDYTECKSPDGFSFFTGNGTFNWILEFDTTAGTLRTGGAELNTDPIAGYCFLAGDIGGFDVAPLEATITIEGGTFAIDEPRDVVVPVFTDASDPSKVVLLPLRNVRIFDAAISADNNCIGSFNADTLDPNNLCLASPTVAQFAAGGDLEGYVTLEDADDVNIAELQNSSLCALIAGAANVDPDTKKCKRDADMAILFEGDWCAGAAEGDPGQPADASCHDAVQLRAGFSASAVELRSDCN